MVTHDIDEAIAMADKVIIMSQNPGEIVGEQDVNLSYPRDRSLDEFNTLKENLFNEFEKIDLAKQSSLAESTPNAQ
ncbi:MAG: ABC transporter ATP-binding protein, partial [Hydrogenovibrio crunogenus]|nr:ABC transporter ATP-binding protein [Hydrogenovibrio crunogenus]